MRKNCPHVGHWQPYMAALAEGFRAYDIGLKLGANYTKMSSDFYIYEVKDNTWGFYVSPEVGVNIYPWLVEVAEHKTSLELQMFKLK